MFSKLLAIAKNTFIETVRQPIFGVLIWVAAFWIGKLRTRGWVVEKAGEEPEA